MMNGSKGDIAVVIGGLNGKAGLLGHMMRTHHFRVRRLCFSADSSASEAHSSSREFAIRLNEFQKIDTEHLIRITSLWSVVTLRSFLLDTHYLRGADLDLDSDHHFTTAEYSIFMLRPHLAGRGRGLWL